MNEALAPLGKLLTISHGSQTVTITEVGAALVSYEIGGAPIIGGPTRPEGTVDVHKGSRGAVLMPWPNRVAGGKYSVYGNTLQLPITEVARGHATHGFVRTMAWDVIEHADNFLTLACLVFAQPGWPFVFAAKMSYELTDDGLAVVMEAMNLGDKEMPFAMGMHPYFTLGADKIDDYTLTLPAQSRLLVDDSLIPNGTAPVEGSEYDFREPRRIGSQAFDTAYGDLIPDDNGITTVVIGDNEGTTLQIWMDSAFRFVQLFSGDTLSLESDRRHTIAVEPMTGAPDAFNSGDGLITLAPQQSVRGAWGVRVD